MEIYFGSHKSNFEILVPLKYFIALAQKFLNDTHTTQII